MMFYSIDRLLLDVDMVLADFHTGVAKVFGEPEKGTFGENPTPDWAIEAHFGLSKNKFWKRIYAEPDFWENLEELPWARDLYTELTKLGPVTLCTKPPLNPAASTAKVRWIHKFLGKGARNWMITPTKEAAAGPSIILIDDHMVNCEDFEGEGGHSCLFPSSTNYKDAWRLDPLAHVLKEVKEIMEAHR